MKSIILTALQVVLYCGIAVANNQSPEEKAAAKWLRGIYRENELATTKLSDGKKKNDAYNKYWECLKTTSFLSAKKCLLDAVESGEINISIPDQEGIEQLEQMAQKREAEEEAARRAYIKAKKKLDESKRQPVVSNSHVSDAELVERALSSFWAVGLLGVLSGRYKDDDERIAAFQELQRRHPEWEWDAIMTGKVRTGMTQLEAIMSWGEPYKINHASYGDQWIYRRGDYHTQYLYFENGILTSFNEN